MFEKCSKVDKICAFCTISTYSPNNFNYSGDKKEFCGVAGSYDTRVSSLPDCWLKMSRSQKTTYTRKRKDEYRLLKVSGGT